jgi:membrane-associated protease RseP (regulator of RpoE activity)
VLLAASVVVVVCLTALNDSPLGALAFTVAIVAGLWGPIAAHEGGHAIAALLTGHPVTGVQIGKGRRIFKAGAVSVHVVPLRGQTFYRRGDDTTTPLREALILVAGPAAHLVTAGLILLAALAASDSFFVVLGIAQGGNALLNLSPRSNKAGGSPADGARLYALLRRGGETQPPERPGENAGVRFGAELAARAFRSSVISGSLHRRQAHGHDDRAGQQHDA